MPHAQPGIFALGTRSHHHLQFDLSADPIAALAAVARIREAASTVIGVNVVVGFSHHVWTQLAPRETPIDSAPFEAIEGADGFLMPADQHDLWVWLHGAGSDAVFNVARLASRELIGIATLQAEQASFAYQASQDLTGFEDGTENPPLDEALGAATIIEGPCEGGSIALVQRWVHDLDGFEALELADRERVIGRTFHGSVELDVESQPEDSHVSRVVIESPDGEELEVFRRSTAFGGVLEHGLMFIAFSQDRARLVRMLARMAGAEDGIRDRLTYFSTPTSGAWYVVPPVELLEPLD